MSSYHPFPEHPPASRSRRGSVLISVICFVAVTSFLMVGFAQLVVSYFELARVESDHDSAIDIADAGVNYELNTITANSANADQAGSSTPPGNLYSFGGGTFRVYCENSSGTTPWTAGSALIIVSTGTVNGASRTVHVTAQPVGGSGGGGDYAVFGENTSVINGPTSIHGSVGTNQQLTFNNNVGVTGSVVFNGSGSGWQSTPQNTYTVVHNSTAISWPTVATIASSEFTTSPGGLSYLSTHNDNASYISPALPSNGQPLNANTTFTGKAGGSNFYLTNLTTNGNTISFNNTNGPITIWIGPAGASTTVNFYGGTATNSLKNAGAYPVRMYVATNNDIQQNGNAELDCGIYNINSSLSGRILINGSPTCYGEFISNSININGAPTIYDVANMFSSGQISYYGFAGDWTETNVINY